MCSACEGLLIHLSTPIQPTPSVHLSSPTTSNNNNKPDPPQQPALNISSPLSALTCNIHQLQGITCFVCDQRKEKKFGGKILIGKWREIKFCKKAELKDKNCRLLVEQAIDAQAKLVSESTDQPPGGFSGGGGDDDDDDYEKEQDEAGVCGCDGFANDSAKPCNAKPFSPVIRYITADQAVKHFCKAAHLIRYLLHYHTCKRAQVPTNKRKKLDAPLPAPLSTPPYSSTQASNAVDTQ